MGSALKTLNPEQIAAAKQRVTGLKMLRSLKNPESFLQMAASQNPLIGQALSLGQQNGGNYDAITESILQQGGYDTAAVRQQLVDAGIL